MFLLHLFLEYKNLVKNFPAIMKVYNVKFTGICSCLGFIHTDKLFSPIAIIIFTLIFILVIKCYYCGKSDPNVADFFDLYFYMHPSSKIHLVKVNNINTRKKCEICSKLTIKALYKTI